MILFFIVPISVVFLLVQIVQEENSIKSKKEILASDLRKNFYLIFVTPKSEVITDKMKIDRLVSYKHSLIKFCEEGYDDELNTFACQVNKVELWIKELELKLITE